jgi:hypothetical protein
VVGLDRIRRFTARTRRRRHVACAHDDSVFCRVTGDHQGRFRADPDPPIRAWKCRECRSQAATQPPFCYTVTV